MVGCFISLKWRQKCKQESWVGLEQECSVSTRDEGGGSHCGFSALSSFLRHGRFILRPQLLQLSLSQTPCFMVPATHSLTLPDAEPCPRRQKDSSRTRACWFGRIWGSLALSYCGLQIPEQILKCILNWILDLFLPNIKKEEKWVNYFDLEFILLSRICEIECKVFSTLKIDLLRKSV